MFAASDLDMPLSVETTSWTSELAGSVVAAVDGCGDAGGACAGMGCGFGWRDVVRATGWLPVVVGGSIGAASMGAASIGAGGATGSAGDGGATGSLGSAGALGGVGAGGVEDASIVVW